MEIRTRKKLRGIKNTLFTGVMYGAAGLLLLITGGADGAVCSRCVVFSREEERIEIWEFKGKCPL